jgi:hypothetical protein
MWRICILSVIVVVWVVFRVFSLLIHQSRGDRAVGSGAFLSDACHFCLSCVEPVFCVFPYLNLLYGVVSLYVVGVLSELVIWVSHPPLSLASSIIFETVEFRIMIFLKTFKCLSPNIGETVFCPTFLAFIWTSFQWPKLCPILHGASRKSPFSPLTTPVRRFAVYSFRHIYSWKRSAVLFTINVLYM